jgi:hypothetical protein
LMSIHIEKLLDQPSYNVDVLIEDDLAPARGLINGLLISISLWMVIGLIIIVYCA